MWWSKSRCRRPFRPPAYRRQGWRRQEKGPRNRSKEKETGGEHGELRAARSRRVDRQGWREGKSPHALLPRAPRACLFERDLGWTGRRRRASSRRRPGRPPRRVAAGLVGRRQKKPSRHGWRQEPEIRLRRKRGSETKPKGGAPPPERTLERTVQGARGGGAHPTKRPKNDRQGTQKKTKPPQGCGGKFQDRVKRKGAGKRSRGLKNRGVMKRRKFK